MRRFISRFLLIALLAVVVGFYPLLAPTPHRIDQAHFEMIKEGMTKADVAGIFGVPAGQYDWAEPEGGVRVWFKLGQAISAPRFRAKQIQLGVRWLSVHDADSDNRVSEIWVSRHGAFTVHFDHNDRVGWKVANGARVVPPWQRWWQEFRNR
jgi:hypothetical protein